MSAHCRTTVGAVYSNNSEVSNVRVGMHQGSGLSPSLFAIVMEAISREFWVDLRWELVYVDDLEMIADNEEESEN